MNWFTQDYIDFFTELAFNNEKSWFDVNRKRYENSVREPFKEFTQAVIYGVGKFDPSIGNLQPKDVMFRINRDIRFAKDKTPYNTWLSAAIVKGGKRNEESHPGYYFRFAVDKVSVGGGVFRPSKDHLRSIRSKIAKDPQALHKIINTKKFKSTWGNLQGEDNKILPKEFEQAAKKEPLIRKKSFTYWLEKPEQEVLREDLLEWMLGLFASSARLNKFLTQDDGS